MVIVCEFLGLLTRNKTTDKVRTALSAGHIRVVQSSLLGSILVNLLLVLGLSIVIGGMSYKEQVYNNTTTQLFISLMNLAVFSLIIPVSRATIPTLIFTDADRLHSTAHWRMKIRQTIRFLHSAGPSPSPCWWFIFCILCSNSNPIRTCFNPSIS